MKTLIPSLLVFLCLTAPAQDPVIQDFMDAASMDTIVNRLREFSGEDSCTVYGNRVLIRNRVSNSGNDLAADYIKERFEWYGLDVVDEVYSAGGRNIYAVQEGIRYPDSIFIICGHYDAVANYCADDNASAITAILEAARILSGSCFERTIIYAAWDEEEIGLRGSRHFADSAADAGAVIAGVLNIDMMAYDADEDSEYDIDLNFDGRSEALRDIILGVNEDYEMALVGNVVQPGTFASDHASFWFNDYGAVLFGEAWSNGDVTPGYHTSNDRIGLLNLPYFHEMTRLAIGSIATAAIPSLIDATVTVEGPSLSANQADAAYQWYTCGDAKTAIPGATARTFTPSENGNYSVEVTLGGCTVESECLPFEVVSGEAMEALGYIRIHPNPTAEQLHLAFGRIPRKGRYELIASNGAKAVSGRIRETELAIDVGDLPAGIYVLEIFSDDLVTSHQIVKQ